MTNFRVDSKVVGDVAVLYPQGYLNNIVTEKLEKECSTFLKKGYKKIVLNFNSIEFINSIGISILLGIIDEVKGTDASLYFTNVSRLQDETFEMLGLKKYMRIFPSEAEAVTELQEKS